VKFIITLNTDNAAFDSEDTSEVRRVLAKAADQISDPTASGGSVRDSNGNTVCTWTSEED
jgi:hypothetical protein